MKTINATKQNGETVIKMGERFDYSTHLEFRQAYESSLEDDSISKYSVDLRDTKYMDSSALGMLLVLRERINGRAPINLVNCNRDVRSILEVANFQKLFNIE